MYKRFFPTTMARQSQGSLIIDVKTNPTLGPSFPIEGAIVIVRQFVTPTGDPSIIETLVTNSVGQTDPIQLPAPSFELSQDPAVTARPYSTYSVEVNADGYERFFIQGVQIFDTITSILPVFLVPSLDATLPRIDVDAVFIGPATLYGDYAPKIPEAEVKDVSASGFIVLDEVVVPELVVIHDGSPNNLSLPNYTLPYKDYIKNVASSEIYPTWPLETIRANVIAIISFTLNRVYTEWYRNQGKSFTITSSTAFDHAFFYGRDIFDTISKVVDEAFDIYVKRPNVIQPLLTQYCDGAKVQCPNWMTQWGSKQLAEDGLNAEQILQFYYGDDISFPSAPVVEGIPESYPGTPLRLGDSGSDVRTIQEQLNRISDNFPLIPKVRSDGEFNEATEDAVKTFQEVFYLTPDGIVGKDTWYKISEIYVAVTKIGELN